MGLNAALSATLNNKGRSAFVADAYTLYQHALLIEADRHLRVLLGCLDEGTTILMASLSQLQEAVGAFFDFFSTNQGAWTEECCLYPPQSQTAERIVSDRLRHFTLRRL